MDTQNLTLEKQVDDIEQRLRKVEMTTLETKLKISEFQKEQAELKTLVISSNKEYADKMQKTSEESNSKLDGFKVEVNNSINRLEKKQDDVSDKILNTILGTFNSQNDTKNKIKLQDRKEVWAIIAAITTALIAFLPKLF